MKDLIKQTNLVTSTGRINPNVSKILEKHPGLLTSLVNATLFLVGEDISVQERIFVILSDITQQPRCGVCQTPLRFQKTGKKYPLFCSTKCASNDTDVKHRRRKRAKEVVDETVRKIKETKNTFSKEKKQHIKEKRNKTVVQTYGSQALLIEHNENKRKTTNLERYGVEHCSQSKQVQEKIRTNHPRRNGDVDLNDPTWMKQQHHDSKKTLSDIATEKGVSKHLVWCRMNQHGISVRHHFHSNPQQHVIDFLTNTGVCFETNVTTILPGRKELDVYFPQHAFAIEVNGVFWHSELHGKDKHFHKHKTTLCEEQGIRLLHFWDYEILQSPNVVFSLISSKLKLNKVLFARDCEVVVLTSSEGYQFHSQHHLAGGVYSTYNLGLKHSDQLVAVMSLSKCRFNKAKENLAEFEITRFSCAHFTNIAGGFSRLLKHCISFANLQGATIISYSDNRFSDGAVYQATGFSFEGETPPNYKYFNRSTTPIVLYSRQHFQKHKLPKIFQSVDLNKTEWEIMADQGYDRIWDCGNRKWALDPLSVAV